MKEIKDVSASVKGKLRNVFVDSPMEYEDLLKHFVMERFLYRLGESKYQDHFVLKGALMFTAWNVKDRRITLDIDLLGYFDNKESSIVQVVKDIINTEVVEDGVRFDTDTVKSQKLKEGEKYEGVRIKLKAYIGNSRIPIMIDFGFGDKIFPEPSRVNYPGLLDFPSPEIRGYTIESLMSEKFSAMIEKADANSRMKDFYDLWLIKNNNLFNRENFKSALKATFENRQMELPSGDKILGESWLSKDSPKQIEWENFLDTMTVKTAPEKLCEVTLEIESMMKEILNEIQREKGIENDWGMEL